MNVANLLRDTSREGVRLFCQDGRLGFELLGGSFPDVLRARILASRDELIEHLTSVNMERYSTVQRPAVVPMARDGVALPASFGQERLWFLDRMYGGSAHYNMPAAVRVRGGLDAELVEQALSRVIARHEVLRTLIVEEIGGCRQRIGTAAGFALGRVDLGALPAAERERALQSLVNDDAARPFDLSSDLMLRASFVRLDDDDAVLLLNVHHIAADGWSLEILRREFEQQYAALSRGEPDPLPPLAVQYADYAQWQRDWLQGEVLDQQLAYWERQLANLPVLHNLPLDYARPAVLSFDGAVHSIELDALALDGLKKLAASRQVTLFMLVHAALSLLLARHSGSDDIVIGTPVAARQHKEVEALIGYFANTLVLRTDCGANVPFTDYLADVKARHLDAQSYQEVPFELLVERLKPVRSTSHAPLFQVMFNMADGGPSPDALGAEQVSTKFDLTLGAVTSSDGLHLSFEYNTALFKEATMARMARHLAHLLRAIVADPACPIHTLPMLDDEERRRMLEGFHGRVTDYPREATMHGLFEAQAARTPATLAVVHAQTMLSYVELNRRANQLAHYLRGQGVGSGSLVGVCLRRSETMVVSLLAILKAGGAYVALDPSYPDQRLADMVDDSGIAWLLTQRDLTERLAGHPVLGRASTALLPLDALDEVLALQPQTNPEPLAASGDLAYLIYTSGSTGRPKAVRICHRNAVAMITWGGQEYSGEELRRVLCSTSLNFDLSVFELFVPLSHGGAVVVVENAMALLEGSPDITLLNTVPSACRALVDSGAIPMGVRVVNLAGEALPPALVNELIDLPQVRRVCNLYGPSEDTTYSSWISYADKPGESVSIGRPLDNSWFHILDAHGQPVPLGVAGEIYIGGAGVALGYLNRPELTAERFLDDPFRAGARMYRTGDVGRWREDGTIDYLGRNDFQVKLRGFRIELGEIEARLSACAGVSAAVVTAPGQQRLVAYLTPAHASGLTGQGEADLVAGVRATLKSALPDYMQPSAYVVLPVLPLTANGKVDRKALPAPADVASPDHVPPTTAMERALAKIWSQLLALPLKRIGADANFFELGGHSLLSMRLVAALRAQLGVELTIRDIFDTPKLSRLASLAEGAARIVKAPVVAIARDGVAPPASFGQERMWFLDRMYGGSAHYNMPAAIRVRGGFDATLAEQALSRVIARHEVLRTLIVEENGGCRQRIGDGAGFALGRVDLGALPAAERERALQSLVNDDAARPFDLSSDLMLRASFVRLADDDAVLLLNVHHIAADGWSLEILRREFEQQYATLSRGEPDPLPPLAVQYADYAQWQRDWLQGEVLDQQLAYWERQLANLPVLHNLPLDYARPAVLSFDGAVQSIELDSLALDSLKKLAASRQVTLFMLVHAAFSLLLARHSGSDDIVIGTPVAARQHKEVEALIGYFANTLVLRTDCGANVPFTDYLADVKARHLDAQSYQEVPFELLVERLKPSRSTSHAPLFQVMFNMADGDSSSDALVAEQVSTKFDLTLVAVTSTDGLQLSLEYNTALFKEATMARMARHLAHLLHAIVADPACPIHTLPMLDDEERRQMLESYAGRRSAFPQQATMHGLFEAQATRTPAALAVAHAQTTLSYVELNRRANQLAHYLRAQGVGCGSLVGVCLRRSETMVVALMAILKAGGAYVALDPNYPDQRLADMVDDSDIAWMLTQRDLTERLAGHSVLGRESTALLVLDALDATLALQPEANLQSVGGSGDLAYLIYTSGSTGRPKAVRICHRNAVAMITWGGREYSAAELARVLCSTSLNFDLSVFELFVPLSHGGAVIVVENAMALLEESPEITLLNTVPSACRALVDSGAIPFGVRVVNLAGEALPPALVNELIDLPQVRRVCNLYGPSEDTTYSSWISYTDKPGESVSIGRPLDNSWFYILDAYGQPVPLGVAGEIHIGGAGVALGYLNRPELTAERFLDDPFRIGARMYRTGDLGRWREDGMIDYLGRNDFQVKLRGFRIELGEIEARLSAREGVSAAVVTAPGQQRLVAYLTPADASGLTGQGEADLVAGVRAALKTALPDYMQPSAYVVLPELPLTANGKVDRKALPAPREADAASAYEAPANALEELMAGVWQELIGLPRIGVNDNFFVLGGHSILASRIISRLKSILEVDLSLQQLFVHPSIRSVCDDLKSTHARYEEIVEVAETYLHILSLSPEEVQALLANGGS
ncbi:amino acid adenylation domain-containing protein [Oxalobacteraceae bacterium OTU3REALA1]|nr:amino acid adenylation domain-containing protein [Oxalobacteraceae bacterium OTU3REALA1]